MQRVALIIGGALTLAAVSGWVSANVRPQTDVIAQEGWELLNVPKTTAAQYEAMRQEMTDSGLFPPYAQYVIDQERMTNGGVDISTGSDSPFPKIVAASLVNGEPQVHLMLADNTFIKAVKGTVLDSGWELKEVDLTHVIAVLDGEEKTIPVVDYHRLSADNETESEETP